MRSKWARAGKLFSNCFSLSSAAYVNACNLRLSSQPQEFSCNRYLSYLSSGWDEISTLSQTNLKPKLSLNLLDSSTTCRASPHRALQMVTALWTRCFFPTRLGIFDTQYVTKMLELLGGDRLVISMSTLFVMQPIT